MQRKPAHRERVRTPVVATRIRPLHRVSFLTMFVKSLSLLSLVSLASAFPISWWPWPVTRPGFVTTRGQQFYLDGKPFHFAGTNSYWLQFTQVSSSLRGFPYATSKYPRALLTLLSQNNDDVAHIFDRALEAGHKVIRTWGFHDVNGEFRSCHY